MIPTHGGDIKWVPWRAGRWVGSGSWEHIGFYLKNMQPKCGYSKKEWNWLIFHSKYVGVKFVTGNIQNLCVCQTSEQFANCLPCFWPSPGAQCLCAWRCRRLGRVPTKFSLGSVTRDIWCDSWILCPWGCLLWPGPPAARGSLTLCFLAYTVTSRRQDCFSSLFGRQTLTTRQPGSPRLAWRKSLASCKWLGTSLWKGRRCAPR